MADFCVPSVGRVGERSLDDVGSEKSSDRLGVQNFEGFFTEFGSPVPPGRDEKPQVILNRQPASADCCS